VQNGKNALSILRLDPRPLSTANVGYEGSGWDVVKGRDDPKRSSREPAGIGMA